MIKILPLISFFLIKASFAQPLVHEEPHHVPIIQNKVVRVLNVVANPKDTTLFHIHQNDIGYISIKGSEIWLEEFEAQPRTVKLPTGWTGSNLTHDEEPFIHRFANIGDSTFQLIAVEILTQKFELMDFEKLGVEIYQDERFSFQEISNDVIQSNIPCILLELSQVGEILTLDYLKPKKTHPIVQTADLSRIIAIQFK